MQSMSKHKIAKYKIINTNIDKKFIGKNLDLERVKSKGGSVEDGERKPPKKQKSTRDLLIEFMGEQRVFNKQQLEFNTRIEKQVSNLRSDVNTLKTNLNRVIKLNNLKH